MYLWDSAWQIAAKSNDAGMQQYVDRLAAASGSGGANITGFWFSVVNQNQDINTPNGFGHSFGSYSAPNPDSPPYVRVADRVHLRQVPCIVEAMKLMNEIESEMDGTILEILQENAKPVQFGDPLFKIAQKK